MNVTLQSRKQQGLCQRCGDEPAMRGKSRGRLCAFKEASAYQRKRLGKKVSRVTKLGRVILNSRDLAQLRFRVFERSQGQCEMLDDDGTRCPNMLGWSSMELHHVIHRSLGGSDTVENCKASCFQCHRKAHNQ